MKLIRDFEITGETVTTKMVSDLIKTHANNGDIAGAVKAYYDTCHLATPRQSVLRLVLEKCVVANDKINTGPGEFISCVCITILSVCLSVSGEYAVTFWSRT